MDREKPDQWKGAKNNTEKLLNNAENAKNLVGNIKTETKGNLENLKDLWKKTEEAPSQPKIVEVPKIESPVSQEVSIEEGDIANVKEFIKTLSAEAKENLGLLRYNTWSGEDLS